MLAERRIVGLFGGVGEIMKLFFQRIVLRFHFRYLLLERRVLFLKLSYLSKRNRELKARLFRLRGWHVQLPSADGKPVTGGEHEPKAGADLELGEAGRFEVAGVRNEPSNV